MILQTTRSRRETQISRVTVTYRGERCSPGAAAATAAATVETADTASPAAPATRTRARHDRLRDPLVPRVTGIMTTKLAPGADPIYFNRDYLKWVSEKRPLRHSQVS